MKANKVIKINRLSIKVLALSCSIWSAAQLGFVPSGFSLPPDPSVYGKWGPVLNWNTNGYAFSGRNVAVHLVVLPTGKVIMWPYIQYPRLFDPTTETLTLLPYPVHQGDPHNIFCGAHSHIPDGRVLFTGGDSYAPASFTQGESQASYYNPLDGNWTTNLPPMNGGRWYGTSTALASGDVLVTSGFTANGAFDVNRTAEVWNPAARRWWTLTNATTTVEVPPYTRTFLAPNGKVFFAMGDADAQIPSRFLDATWRPFSTNELWSAAVTNLIPKVPGHNNPKNPVAAACMDEAGTVYWFGGCVDGLNDQQGDPTNLCEKISLTNANPQWTYIAPMTNAQGVAQNRKYHTATILPNGKFLITSGSDTNNTAFELAVGKPALLYNPVSNSWTTLATEAQFRGYHSTAVLLPDGRVLSASGHGESNEDPTNATAEIFSPPYLFNGTNLAVRPVISSAPRVVGYGETFFVGTPDAATITNVTWTRLSSTTHGFNWDQRINTLTFSQNSCGGLNITAPANQTNCPPGYYMLWLINCNGVPSTSSIVRISKGLSGAMVFWCDANGNTASNNPWDTRGPDSGFPKLFVTKGTPLGTPDGLTGPFLNGPGSTNAPLSLKLDPGENKFTIFFQTNGLWTNFFGMNLFFDDGMVGEISVKAALRSDSSTPSFSANSATPTYTFTSYPYPDAPASGTLITGYGRRIELTQYTINAPTIYSRDRVSSSNAIPNSSLDYVGTFTLKVTDIGAPAAEPESGSDNGTFTVTRSGGDNSSALTVYYTVGGTATPTNDYTALSGSVIIPANQSSATISVNVCDDSAYEWNETVNTTLSPNPAYVIGSSCSAEVTIYSFLDLGVLPGGTGSFAFSVNPSSRIAGGSAVNGNSRAFRSIAGQTITGADDLHPGLAQYFGSPASNSTSVVWDQTTNRFAGEFTYAGVTKAWVWGSCTGYQALVAPGSSQNFIRAVSDWEGNTEGAGFSVINGTNRVCHWFIYDCQPQSTYTYNIGGSVGGGYHSYGLGIKWSKVVGFVAYPTGNKGFIWDWNFSSYGPTYLNPPPGGGQTEAYDIDKYSYSYYYNYTNIVGYATTNGLKTACYWTYNGYNSSGITPTLLTKPAGWNHSIAQALNDQNKIVGNYYQLSAPAETNRLACLWDGGTLVILNNIVPVGSTWVLLTAEDINSQNHVVGLAWNGTQVRGFRLKP
jgi:hypothetical protein